METHQDEYHRGALKIDDKFGGSATDQYEAMFKVGCWVSYYLFGRLWITGGLLW